MMVITTKEKNLYYLLIEDSITELFVNKQSFSLI